MILSHAYGPPTPPLVFSFFLEAVLGFAVVGAMAFGGVTVEFGGELRRVQLWGSFRFVSVGLAVGAVWLLSAHAPSLPGWTLGAFVATATYLVIVGAENTADDRRTQEEGYRDGLVRLEDSRVPRRPRPRCERMTGSGPGQEEDLRPEEVVVDAAI